MSESLYLHDAEKNGMEIYADRPKSQWMDWKEMSKEFAVTGDPSIIAPMTQPLDVESLLDELDKGELASPVHFPRGAKIGHMHLRVTDLRRSVKFYHEALGLDIMMDLAPMGAAFLSAGGYHHHFGLNTWHSLGGHARKEADVGLDEVKLVVPDKAFLKVLAGRFEEPRTIGGGLVVNDPDGIRISIVTVTS